MRQANGARVDGSVVSLAFHVEGRGLADAILGELAGLDRCAVVQLRERRTRRDAPRGGDAGHAAPQGSDDDEDAPVAL